MLNFERILRHRTYLLCSVAVAIFILLGSDFFISSFFRDSKYSCNKVPADSSVKVTLNKKIGNIACGYEGVKVNLEYHKTVYEGNDGCNYIVTDKRITRYKEEDRDDVYFYSLVGEGDKVLGNVTGIGMHCLDLNIRDGDKILDEGHLADYIPVQTISKEIIQSAFHFHHNGLLKKVD